MKKSWIGILTLFASCFILSACSTNSKPDEVKTAADATAIISPASLDDRSFVLQKVNDTDISFDEAPPEILFNKDLQIAGGICNRFQGKAELEGNILKAPELAATKMLCEPALNDLETSFFQMMQTGATITLDKDQLTMADPKTNTIWVFKSVAAPTIEKN